MKLYKYYTKGDDTNRYIVASDLRTAVIMLEEEFDEDIKQIHFISDSVWIGE